MHERQITETRNQTDPGLDKRWILRDRFLKLVDCLFEILLQLGWINRVIETVDGASPLIEAAPIADARRQFLIRQERR